MKFYLMLLSGLFVFQTGALNKENIFNPSLPEVDFNWAEDTVMDGVEVNSHEMAKLVLNTGSVVSHVVLFENKMPVCVANVAGRPELVPHFMRVKDHAPQISGMDLPSCDDFYLSVLEAKAREALLINGEEPVQMAALLETSATLCIFGGAFGFAARLMKSTFVRDMSYSDGNNRAHATLGVALLTGTAIQYVSFMESSKVATFTPKLPLLKGLSITGLCGLGTYYTTEFLFYLGEMD